MQLSARDESRRLASRGQQVTRHQVDQRRLTQQYLQ
jgi:hypothetical protein